MIFYEVIFYFYWDVQHSFMLTWNHIFKCGFMKIYSGLTGTLWSEHLSNNDLLDENCPGTRRVRLKYQGSKWTRQQNKELMWKKSHGT